jgi:hypothetical protein
MRSLSWGFAAAGISATLLSPAAIARPTKKCPPGSNDPEYCEGGGHHPHHHHRHRHHDKLKHHGRLYTVHGRLNAYAA